LALERFEKIMCSWRAFDAFDFLFGTAKIALRVVLTSYSWPISAGMVESAASKYLQYRQFALTALAPSGSFHLPSVLTSSAMVACFAARRGHGVGFSAPEAQTEVRLVKRIRKVQGSSA
jgi:hypothetical protein